MVKGSVLPEQRLNKLFNKYKAEILAGRKRFEVKDLEQYLIKKLGGVSNYAAAGGYQGLYQLLTSKEGKGEIAVIKSSQYNGRIPPLKKRWQLSIEEKAGWEQEIIFKLSRYLDLGYYLKRPRLQTQSLLDRIIDIYIFIKNKDQREWASREERSLELFGDEKFLATPDGKRFLSRLKLVLSDLKAEKYSQMFVYWKLTAAISRVLILENHAAFIACKRALAAGYTILGLQPDTLIYGSGKQIVKSLRFLEEIIETNNPDKIIIKYAGDIDPVGLEIYYALKQKYRDYNLSLFKNYYQEMFKQAAGRYNIDIKTNQNKNKAVLDYVIEESQKKGCYQLAENFENYWQQHLRIPQEVITYEVIKCANKDKM